MKSRLSVLIVPPNDLLRHPIPNRLYHIGRRLAYRHTVYLLTYNGHPLALSRRVRYMKAFEVNFKPLIKNVDVGFYYLANLYPIANVLDRILTRNSIDIVIHANILPSFIAVRIAKRHNIPSIYDYLDHFPESASMYYNHKLMRNLSYMSTLNLIRYNLRKSSLIVTVSHTFRKILSGITNSASKVVLIPNGVDHELFRPIQTSRARKLLGLDEYDTVLLYYGSIDAWLEIGLLFKMLRDIKGVFGNVVLVVMGIAHNRAIHKLLENFMLKYNLYGNVLIIPPQSYEKVPLYINASDIVIAPYKKVLKNYTTPLKVLESLACAKPVITRNIKEYYFWFNEDAIVFYESEEELKDSVIDVIKKLDEKRYILKKESQRVRTVFAWDKIASIYEGLIKSIY